MKAKTALATILFVLPMALPAPADAQLGGFSFGDEKQTAKIAYFKLKGALLESPAPTSGFPLLDLEPPMSLNDLVRRLKEARSDPAVKALVVDLQSAQPGLAQIEEIRDALSSFAAVDKEVYVHADTLMTGTYALATGASHISIVPQGDLWLLGLYGETPYLKGMFDKMGLIPDFEHCGDYKSAHEPFTRTGPSEEAQEMTDWLLDGLFESIVHMIAESRELAPEKVQALIDRGRFTADEALEAGLIDAVEHRQDFVASLKKRYGADVKFAMDYGKKDAFEVSDNFFEAFGQLMKLLNPMPKTYTKPSVAIVYVDGAIMPGEAEPNPFGGSSGAFSTTVRKALDKAAEQDSVKAVVLRVDSPGGSALASEIIWDATQRVAKRKPLIVSMGNVAGSGGYYVSCGADTIFADPTTITASIGVLGGKIVTTGGWKKLGINWSANQRGEMAALLSSATPFSDEERANIVKYMTDVYKVFKSRVTAGRGDRLTKPIDEMAGGRVYTGAQALALGLVDRLGGLDDAIKFAAKQANLVEPEIRVIPEPPTIFDMFMPKDKEFANLDAGSASVGAGLRFARGMMSLAKHPAVQTLWPAVESVDPLRAKAIMQSLLCAELIHNEGAVTMMPAGIIIR